jgi:hypothetical protein
MSVWANAPPLRGRVEIIRRTNRHFGHEAWAPLITSLAVPTRLAPANHLRMSVSAIGSGIALITL